MEKMLQLMQSHKKGYTSERRSMDIIMFLGALLLNGLVTDFMLRHSLPL